jgi:hypothetical protein
MSGFVYIFVAVMLPQDQERKRIGRDLHDSLGQYLAVLKLKLESVALIVGSQPDLAAKDVADCIRLTDDSIKEVRNFLFPQPRGDPNASRKAMMRPRSDKPAITRSLSAF